MSVLVLNSGKFFARNLSRGLRLASDSRNRGNFLISHSPFTTAASSSNDNTKKDGNAANAAGEVKDVPIDITDDEALQPEWRALESRVNNRRTRAVGEGTPQGRSPRRGSAWDHETV